jgi:hypothetical protein
MRVARPRSLSVTLLAGFLFAIQAGGVGAQVLDPEPTPNPIDAVEGPGGPDQGPADSTLVPEPDPTPIETSQPTVDPPPEIAPAPEETTQEPAPAPDPVTGGVGETTVETGGAGDTGGDATGGTDNSTDSGGAPSLAETVEEAGNALGGPDPVGSLEESVAEVSPKLVEAIAEVVQVVEGTVQEEAGPELVPGDSAADAREGGARSLSKAGTTEAIKTWAESGGSILSSLGGIFGSAQPSFAILVDAMNDADGDGSFSDVEIAPIPNGDVRFHALISNIGSTNFEITSVNHSYAAVDGRVQAGVCEKLVGLVLLAGDSVPCTFSLADYAPARGESVVNTITAAAFEIGSPKRGASDSDISTVDTLVADEVLAVAVSNKEPGVLAFTGMDAVGLIILAITLLASGAALTQLGRMRRLRQQRAVIGADPWLELELLRWWDSNGQSPVPQEKISP